MNVTKRKFNALLNGIGNKSTTSLASAKDVNNTSQTDLTSPTTPDAQSKKRRTSNSSSDFVTRPLTPAKNSPAKPPLAKSTVSKLSSGTVMAHKKSASAATATADTSTPKYAPWDRGEFLKRLKTFSNLADWTPKPAKVNEVEWAKRGWVCQKFERVRCCVCHVEILVKLNKKEVDGKEEDVYVAQNIEDALVDKYVELIVTSHDDDCLWRQRGCDDSIFKLPLTNALTSLETLRERYDQVCTRNDNLPYIFNMKPPPELDLDLVLSYLPNNFFETGARVNRVAFMMALFGWEGHAHGRMGQQTGSISCHACFRVLGLWLFKSKKVNAAGEEIEGAVVNNLDPITEHRDYCPWRNAASQNGLKASSKAGSTSVSGWETVIRVLKNDYYLRTGKQSGSTPKKAIAEPVATEISSEVDSILDEGEELKNRDEKDKERWARLRRVKSLFDTKAGKRLSRSEKSEKGK